MKMFRSLKLFKKNSLYILSLLLVGFIFRLMLTNLGYHVDILSTGAWGEWIYNNGTKGFFYNSEWIYAWPTQLPVINLIHGFNYWLYIQLLELFRYLSSYVVPHLAPGHMLWWFKFVIWFDVAKYPESPLHLGYLVTTKLLPIIADILIAAVIYFLALKKYPAKKALIWPSLYLFSPFSWYISSLWGQVDQLSFVFLLISFLLLYNNKVFLAIIAIFLSVGIKPTSLIFIPYFIFLLFKVKSSIPLLITSFLIVGIFFYYTTIIFTYKPITDFIGEDLVYKIFYKSEFRVSTNSFNFWHILIGNKALNEMTPFLGLPAKIWGLLGFLIFNILAIKIFNPKKLESIFLGAFLISSGGWMFMTNMLERYYFNGIVFLLVLTVYFPKLIKYWLIISIIFWINLYHGWWFPEEFNDLRLMLILNDGFPTRIISLINVLIFVICVHYLIKFQKIK